jgi:hypothetical protein
VTSLESDESIIVSFEPLVAVEVGVEFLYTATSFPGGAQASGPLSPLLITGLTNGVEYETSVTSRRTNSSTGGGLGATGAASPRTGAVTPFSLGTLRHCGFHSVAVEPLPQPTGRLHGDPLANMIEAEQCSTSMYVWPLVPFVQGQPVHFPHVLEATSSPSNGGGARAIVPLNFFFWNPPPSLHPSHVAFWQDCVAKLTPFADTIECFYLDEPIWNVTRMAPWSGSLPEPAAVAALRAQAETDLQSVVNLVKASFPNVPFFVVYAYTEVRSAMNVPSNVDWVGANDYRETFESIIPSMYAVLRSRSVALHPHQKMWMVPQAFNASFLSQSESQQISNFEKHFEYARQNADVIGMFVFLWSWSDVGYKGAKQLPSVLAHVKMRATQVKYAAVADRIL